MKNLAKILAVVILAIAFNANAFAQATATATATIVTPISVAHTGTDMSFGNVVAGAGTVVLDPDGTRTATGAVTFLPSLAGTISPAVFTISGMSGATYDFNLPATCTISDGTNNMTVDNFTTDASGTLPAATEVVNVGATLNVNAGQTPGVYNSTADFTVTVNYN